MAEFTKNLQYYKFCLYGFFKNLKFFEPFILLFFLSKDIGYFQIGVLYAVREISIYLLEIPTGVFADVLGRKKTMMASFLAYIFSFVVFYFSNVYGLLILGMLFFSIADALRTGTHKAMIFDYLKLNSWQDQKVKYYGNTRSYSQIGSAVSSIIAAFIVIVSGNYSLVFLVAILPYLINFFLIWSYPKVLDGPIKKSESVNVKLQIKRLWLYIKRSAGSKQLFPLLLNVSLYQGYFKSVKDYIQPIAVFAFGSVVLATGADFNKESTLLLGLLYFIIYMISSLASRHSNVIVKLLKSKERVLNLTLLLGALVGVLSGIFVKKGMIASGMLVFVLIFVLQNIRKPVGSVLLSEKVKNEVMATALSVQSLFDSLFAAVMALILGFLADLFSLEFGLTATGLILILLFPFAHLHNTTIKDHLE